MRLSGALNSLLTKPIDFGTLRSEIDMRLSAVLQRRLSSSFAPQFRERIRQIEAKALRKLKHPIRSRILRSFLDK